MSDANGGGPHERLVGRLRELADAVTHGRDVVAREFTMRVPAEPERDADMVLSNAADELDRLRAENEALRAALQAADHRVVYGVWASGYSYDIFQRALGRLPPTAP